MSEPAALVPEQWNWGASWSDDGDVARMPSSDFGELCPSLVIHVLAGANTTMADGRHEHARGDVAGTTGPVRMGSSVRGGQRGIGMLQPTDPTDPEVPAAKRLRAARRQRTLIVAATAV